jgi:hypothetical protein
VLDSWILGRKQIYVCHPATLLQMSSSKQCRSPPLQTQIYLILRDHFREDPAVTAMELAAVVDFPTRQLVILHITFFFSF